MMEAGTPDPSYAPAMRRPFSQVDVFTSVPYMGNPLAVVADGEGLTTDEMQHFASWTNLSETTFLLEPTSEQADKADYRVRIFTPDRELPFAGHPTLGTCRVWLDHGGVPRRPGLIVQECGSGLVTIRISGNRLAFAAPALVRSGPVSAEHLAAACNVLGIDPNTSVVDASWADNGPPWMAVLLGSAEEVLSLRPEAAGSAAPYSLFIGTVGPSPPGAATDFEVRAFFPLRGTLVEDPVTGSLNASLGQWLTAAGHATAPYTASQGGALGRDGRIYIERDPDGTIWVGGDTVTCVQGTVDI